MLRAWLEAVQGSLPNLVSFFLVGVFLDFHPLPSMWIKRG